MIEFFTLDKVIKFIVSYAWIPIIISYYNTFLIYRSKHGKLLSYTAWSFLWLAEGLIGNLIFQSMMLHIVFSLASWTVIGLLLYKSKWKTVLLVSISLFCMTALLEGIVGLLFWGFGICNLAEHQIVGWLISKILTIMLIRIIRINHKTTMSGEVNLTYWMMSMLFPVGSVLIVYIIFELNVAAKNQELYAASTLAMFIMLMINIFAFGIYDWLQKEAATRQRNRAYEQQAEIFKLQCEEWQTRWVEIKSLHHDFKSHLICMQTFNRKNDHTKLENYLEQLLRDYSQSGQKIISGNTIVDALLNYKMKEVEKEGVKLITEFEIAYYLPIEDSDLCIVIGNAFANAVEAVVKLPEEKRKIELRIKFVKNLFYLQIRNPYTGKIMKNKEGKLLTRKEDKQKHGLGLHSLEKTVHKYNGAVEIEADNHMFSLNLMMYGKPEYLKIYDFQSGKVEI